MEGRGRVRGIDFEGLFAGDECIVDAAQGKRTRGNVRERVWMFLQPQRSFKGLVRGGIFVAQSPRRTEVTQQARIDRAARYRRLGDGDCFWYSPDSESSARQGDRGSLLSGVDFTGSGIRGVRSVQLPLNFIDGSQYSVCHCGIGIDA